MLIQAKSDSGKNRPKRRPNVPAPGTPQPPVFVPRGEDKRRGVLFAPELHIALKQGVETMAAPLAATLGPLGRTVAVASIGENHTPPELLSDAATIARRLIEIPNRYVNAGAMLIRHLAWQARESMGDGSATAAVLARAMIVEGLRMVAAGANPVMISRGIEEGVREACAQLAEMAQPLEGRPAIAALSAAATGDEALAELMAEIFEMIGPDGPVIVEEYLGTILDKEFVDNIRWDSGLADTDFVTDKTQHAAVLLNPVIVLADLEVSSASQVIPVVEQAHLEDAESLVMIARKFEGEALAALLLNSKKGMPIAPITAPGLVLNRPEILKDLAILCGGTLIDESAGLQLEAFRARDFGGARRVVANRSQFTMVNPKGKVAAIQSRIAALKRALAEEKPTAQPDTLRRRLANLSGGTAILKIGAVSEAEGKRKRRAAEDASRAVRAALQEGTVPGGGAAYMACVPALEALAAKTEDGDYASGVRIAAAALAAPLQQIAANAGYAGSTIAERVRTGQPGNGFEAFSGLIVDMRAAGIVDPALVLRHALKTAAGTAAMLLTTEAAVLTKRIDVKDVAYNP